MTTPDTTPAAGSTDGPPVPLDPDSPLGRLLAEVAETGTVPSPGEIAALPTDLDDAEADAWFDAVETYAESIARTVRGGDQAKARAMAAEIPAEVAAGLPSTTDEPTDDATPATVVDRVRR